MSFCQAAFFGRGQQLVVRAEGELTLVGVAGHIDVHQAALAPYLSVHGLRHSWAALALQAGIHPKIVQERLGHSRISITLDIYSHVNPAMDADAANTVAALIRAR